MRAIGSRIAAGRTLLLVAALALSAGGCRGGAVQSSAAAPAALPPLAEMPPAGSTRFQVDARESDLRVVVYRGGPLAKFGHNHVLRAGDLKGEVYLAPDFHRSAFLLEFSAAGLIVDPADARLDEGPDFATAPSPQAIEGTRANLLGPRVLDAANYPAITLRSVSIAGSEANPVVTVRVGLHGVERELSFPGALERDGDRLIASGSLLLHTPDFGIARFTAMGGGLRVEEQLKIRFRVVAVKEGR